MCERVDADHYIEPCASFAHIRQDRHRSRFYNGVLKSGGTIYACMGMKYGSLQHCQSLFCTVPTRLAAGGIEH